MGAEGFEPPSAGFHHGGSYPPRIFESSLQLLINCQQTLTITLDNWSPPVCQVSLYSLGYDPDHFLRNFAALFLLLIFFLRHFQRWLPRFFQARELLFMLFPLHGCPIAATMHLWRARRDFRSPVRNFRTRGVWLRRPALYPG